MDFPDIIRMGYSCQTILRANADVMKLPIRHISKFQQAGVAGAGQQADRYENYSDHRQQDDPEAGAFIIQHVQDALFGIGFSEGHRTGGDPCGLSAAGQQRGGIGFSLSQGHVFHHMLVTSQLHIPAEQAVAQPHQGIEPVDAQNPVAQDLEPVVMPGDVGILMVEDKSLLLIAQAHGQVNSRREKAQDEGRVQSGALKAAVFDQIGLPHPALQPEIAHQAGGKHHRHTQKPYLSGNIPVSDGFGDDPILHAVDQGIRLDVFPVPFGQAGCLDRVSRCFQGLAHRVLDQNIRHLHRLLSLNAQIRVIQPGLQAERALNLKGQSQPQSRQEPQQAEQTFGSLFQQEPKSNHRQNHDAALKAGLQNGRKQFGHGLALLKILDEGLQLGHVLRFQLLTPGKGGNKGGQAALKGLLHHFLQPGFLALTLGHQGGDGGILVFQHPPLG